MPAFVSDEFYKKGNTDQEGVVQKGIEVSPWSQFPEMIFKTRLLVLDLNLERYISEGGRHSSRSIEGTFRDHFRHVFAELYERALTHLNQGGVILILLGEPAPIPRSQYSNKSRISSYDWLRQLEVISTISKINKTGQIIEVEDEDLERYLDNTGNHYSVSLSAKAEEHANVLARSSSGKPIAAEVQAYQDDSAKVRTDRGSLILLPQPRTWKQNPTMIARYVEEIGRKRLPQSGWRKYERDAGSSVSTKTIETVLRKFHKAAGALATENGEGQMEMENERDVQDLLEAGLKLYFDDVRREVGVEDFGGSSGKIDFVVGDVGVAIEVKITRGNRTRAKLIEQISKAKESYTRHSDVNRLYIFIYVADKAHLPNIAGLRKDIEDDMTQLIVVPQ